MQHALRAIGMVASLMALVPGFDARAQASRQPEQTSAAAAQQPDKECIEKPEKCLPSGRIGQGSGMLNRPIDPGVLKGILNQQRQDLIRQ